MYAAAKLILKYQEV